MGLFCNWMFPFHWVLSCLLFSTSVEHSLQKGLNSKCRAQLFNPKSGRYCRGPWIQPWSPQGLWNILNAGVLLCIQHIVYYSNLRFHKAVGCRQLECDLYRESRRADLEAQWKRFSPTVFPHEYLPENRQFCSQAGLHISSLLVSCPVWMERFVVVGQKEVKLLVTNFFIRKQIKFKVIPLANVEFVVLPTL